MTGKVHAELMLVRRKRDARRTLDGLARIREPGGGQRSLSTEATRCSGRAAARTGHEG